LFKKKKESVFIMKKQTKVLATMSAAALLAVGFSAVGFAAGWDNSTGSWQYIGNDGEAVIDEWKTSNGQKFYLGDDGNMVTDSLIEDTSSSSGTEYYYVDANGAMVTNTWKAVAMDDDDNTDLDAEYWWYYFGSDGKAYKTDEGKELTKARIKTINGLKYGFDEEGHMLYGWIDPTDKNQNDDDDKAWLNPGTNYYFNGWNDGHAATGWQQIDVVNSDDEDKTYWFHFNSYGKRDTGRKKINGKYYHLDSTDGHMLDEWDGLASDASGNTVVGSLSATTSTSYIRYLNGDGAERKNKWVWAIPDENWINDDYENDEYSWFYFNKSGKLVTNELKKINGKTYAFDSLGRMQTGLVHVDSTGDVAEITDDWAPKDWGDYTRAEWIAETFAPVTQNGVLDTTATSNLYYFNENEEKDGRRMTGYQTISLDDGDYQFYFDSKTGKASSGYLAKIKKYVANGLVIKPTNDDDNNYLGLKLGSDGRVEQIHVMATDMEPGDVIVNKSGAVVKKKVKDENGYYLYFRADGKFDHAEEDN
jgi:glucan-binding YG repeat protein